jgi:hypothetical protein
MLLSVAWDVLPTFGKAYGLAVDAREALIYLTLVIPLLSALNTLLHGQSDVENS